MWEIVLASLYIFYIYLYIFYIFFKILWSISRLQFTLLNVLLFEIGKLNNWLFDQKWDCLVDRNLAWICSSFIIIKLLFIVNESGISSFQHNDQWQCKLQPYSQHHSLDGARWVQCHTPDSTEALVWCVHFSYYYFSYLLTYSNLLTFSVTCQERVATPRYSSIVAFRRCSPIARSLQFTGQGRGCLYSRWWWGMHWFTKMMSDASRELMWFLCQQNR